MANPLLSNAQQSKKDEFYTQLIDIENELKHYKNHFRDKVVFLNCDDPFESNFFKYFAANFNHLGLKKLIATSYKPSPVANTQLGLFGDDRTIVPDRGRPKVTANKFIINEAHDIDGNGAVTIQDIAEQLRANQNNEWAPLEGDGDFRSDECVELLKEADIVCTNPPFSLFREYIAQLVEYDKRFLIIGNQNAITYKEVFKLIKDNKLWLGFNNFDGSRFEMPKDYYNGSKYQFFKDGRLFGRVAGVRWFTNLDVSIRHENITMFKKYNPELYPKYDNYNGIEVSKVSDIPIDWSGDMGVPITFLTKYNPEQFEIVKFRKGDDDKDLTINGKSPYFRILIRKRKAE